MFCWPCISV